MEINSKTRKTTREIDERAGNAYLEGYGKTLSEAIREGDFPPVFRKTEGEKLPRKRFGYGCKIEPIYPEDHGKPLSEVIQEGGLFLVCHEEEKQHSGLLEE